MKDRCSRDFAERQRTSRFRQNDNARGKLFERSDCLESEHHSHESKLNRSEHPVTLRLRLCGVTTESSNFVIQAKYVLRRMVSDCSENSC